MKKKKLYILVGCPGLGKSTWIKNHLHTFDGYTSVISRDNIRFLLTPENEGYFSREKDVFKKYIEDIKDGLEYCDNTIADATHLNEASRSKLLRALGQSLRNVEVNAIVIRGSLETALSQNENRIGTRAYVPQTVVRRMFNQFTMPTFEEGFDKIYIYNPYKEGAKYTIFEKE